MRRILGVALVIGLAGCGREPDDGPHPPPWTPDMQAVADGNNRFALELYGQLKAEPGNLFFSPYSAHTALSMTAAGAKGNTRDEMVKVLYLPADPDKAFAAGDLGKFYAADRKDYELSVVNALWGQRGFPWRPEFLALQQDRFGAGFREADFAANPDGERMRINAWVEEQTHNRIKDLLRRGQVTSQTTMVLANAVYFKGSWAERFDPKKTQDAKFHLADGRTTVTVPMMYGEVKCGYVARDGVKLLELPYRGGDLSMVVILPDLPDGLPEVERQLTADSLTKWLAGLQDRAEMPVYLPRFRIELRFELAEHLKALGMRDAFSLGAADFGGMATAPPGAISAVAHKAFVDVNEEGTEAAAVTAVVIADSAFPPPFTADRPFLFLIRDVRHGTILFMGRVTDPTV